MGVLPECSGDGQWERLSVYAQVYNELKLRLYYTKQWAIE